MLHIEAANANALQQPPNDNITVVRHGEQAFSQIRRFIIVEVRNGFVIAWCVTPNSLHIHAKLIPPVL